MALTPTLPDKPDYPDAVVRENGSWFELSLGVLSGRVQVGADYHMILGQLISTEPGTMLTGDYIEVTQENVNLTGVDYITFPAQVVGRAIENPSVAWSSTIIVNSTVYGSKEIKTDKIMNWADFRVPVSLVTGMVDVTVRLTLIEV
ncbi:MAG: hypothetical protein GY841_15460 [FCB group bacterium]|nr:hypothetical protein [FCB group bacterium]